MIWMLIVGYCYGIQHERRLCEEIKLLKLITPQYACVRASGADEDGQVSTAKNTRP
jgi:hypothetical protein